MRNGFPTTISVVQNDYGYALPFTLQDSTGAALDLTNATSVHFKAQLDASYPVQFNNAMVVTSASTGGCEYVVQSTDFVLPGIWNAQIVVSYAGEVITFDGIQVTVSAEVPVG
jgi:hypothetical protein